MSRLIRRFMFVLCGLLILAGCSVNPPKNASVVQPFDLERYLGTWYEIARLDHSFERGLNRVSAEYSVRPDGRIKVLNSGYRTDTGARKEVEGVAQFIGSPHVGSLKVSFFGPFYGGYHIVALDPNYQWAMVLGDNTDYLWILSRTPTLAEPIKQQLLKQAAELGVDTEQLIWMD